MEEPKTDLQIALEDFAFAANNLRMVVWDNLIVPKIRAALDKTTH